MKTFSNRLDTVIFKTVLLRKRAFYKTIISSVFKEVDVMAPMESPLMSLKVTLSEEEIAKGVLNLEDKAFEEIYRKAYPQIERKVKQYNGSAADAWDVFQDALVYLVEKIKLGSLDKIDSPSGFVYRIAENKWNNEYKKKANRDDILNREKGSFPSDLEPIDDSLLDIEKPDEFEPLSKSLDELSETCRTLIEEYYYKSQDWDTVAKSLGYSYAHSARNQKHKCIKELRLRMVALKYNI